MHHDMIMRITKYYRTLHKLKSLGLERVFANNLGDAAGVNATIVRKDFSLLNIIGQKRGGYEIDRLISNLDAILGKDKMQKAIIVGCGRIGGALMRYRGFASDGLQIVAGFDINPNICSEEDCPVPVYDITQLEEVLAEQKVQVAILSVPEQEASDLFHRLIRAGIRGFLNFTPIGLKASKDESDKPIIVHDVNIALELEQIFYEINISENQLKKA
ncbi:MAG: redox-sensing transcriptional repressor Rex [Spirochaetota bacterium]